MIDPYCYLFLEGVCTCLCPFRCVHNVLWRYSQIIVQVPSLGIHQTWSTYCRGRQDSAWFISCILHRCRKWFFCRILSGDQMIWSLFTKNPQPWSLLAHRRTSCNCRSVPHNFSWTPRLQNILVFSKDMRLPQNPLIQTAPLKPFSWQRWR